MRFPRHRGDESISPPGQCFDVLRRVRGIAKRLPHLLDRGVQAVLEIDEGVRFPQAIPQFLARGNLAGMLEERGEDLPRLVLEPDTVSVTVQLTSGRVELERSKPQKLSGQWGCHGGLKH